MELISLWRAWQVDDLPAAMMMKKRYAMKKTTKAGSSSLKSLSLLE